MQTVLCYDILQSVEEESMGDSGMDLFLFRGPRMLLLRACIKLAKCPRAVCDILWRFWKTTNNDLKFLQLKLEIQYKYSLIYLI